MAEPAAVFLQDLTDLLNNCQRRYDDEHRFSPNEFEFCRRKLEYYLSVLEYTAETLQSGNIQMLADEVRPWLQWLDSQPISRSHCCTNPASIQSSGQEGFNITSQNLEFLRDSGFKWTHISKMFGVSLSTITRRVQEYGLQSSQTFSDISDTALRNVITEIHLSHVDAGCSIVRGMLRARGIHVTMRRIHETLHAVDPILSAQRWGAMVQRRQYSVKAANSLWHVDSHHSLIRWRLIVHGGKETITLRNT